MLACIDSWREGDWPP